MNRPAAGESNLADVPKPGTVHFFARLGQWLIWCRPGYVTGLALWLSFPPIGWSWLAWFALVPLATLVRTPWRSRPIYRPAWIGGLVFGLLAVQWLRYADDQGPSGYYGWVTLATYMSLYFPLWLFIVRVAVLRFRAPAMLAVPVVWVGLEFLRSWFLSGFPWYFLAHSQYRHAALIQVADVAGAYGVSFVVALFNGWLVDLLAAPLLRPTAAGPRIAREQVWRLAALFFVLAGTLAYGWLRRHENEPADVDSPPIVVIQTNIPQQVKEDKERIPEIHRGYRELLDKARALRPGLVVWPETAFREYFLSLDPALTDESLQQLFRDPEARLAKVQEYAADVRNMLVAMAQRVQAPMLMGVNFEQIGTSHERIYNTALLISPDGSIAPPYHKVNLVPWGEYLPLREWLPWMHIFTPHASSDYGLTEGTERVRFRWKDGGDLRFGVLICFEDTMPHAARSYVASDPVDFLVNISNDGWFGVVEDDGHTPGIWRRAQHEIHLAISIFRAVECRRPLVRAVNTGISAIIDSSGHIKQVAGRTPGTAGLTSEILSSGVRLDRRRAPYAAVGDWLGAASLLASGLAVVAGVISSAWPPRPS
jgi:apolipoprotein N-acyltransferase